MYRKVLVGGVTAAAILGTGGAALAASGSSGGTTAGTPSASTSATSTATSTAKHHRSALGRALHGQFVTKGKSGFVTHDLIRGTVTSVSATSITVQAADKVSETYAITKDTKVRVRAAGKGAAGTITDVTRGAHVGVTGTGSTALTAQRIVVVTK